MRGVKWQVSMAFARTCARNSSKFLTWTVQIIKHFVYQHKKLTLVIFVRKSLSGEENWTTPMLWKIYHFGKFLVFLHFKNPNNPYKPKKFIAWTDLWNWGQIQNCLLFWYNLYTIEDRARLRRRQSGMGNTRGLNWEYPGRVIPVELFVQRLVRRENNPTYPSLLDRIPSDAFHPFLALCRRSPVADRWRSLHKTSIQTPRGRRNTVRWTARYKISEKERPFNFGIIGKIRHS